MMRVVIPSNEKVYENEMKFLHVQRRRAGLAAIGSNSGKLRTLRIRLMCVKEQAAATGVFAELLVLRR